tara:strand:- start:245 stop:571 length:327 start_codon:yes stop_codon:yes gene_type:complete
MTRDRYFEMQEQMGVEVLEEDIPPDMEDLPDIVLQAIETFNLLGDRVYPEIGYVGKDYTSLPIFFNTFGVADNEKEFYLELLNWLDTRAIKKAAEELKRQYDKMKRKK